MGSMATCSGYMNIYKVRVEVPNFTKSQLIHTRAKLHPGQIVGEAHALLYNHPIHRGTYVLTQRISKRLPLPTHPLFPSHSIFLINFLGKSLIPPSPHCFLLQVQFCFYFLNIAVVFFPHYQLKVRE
uniref:Uncharacterized protein n=1 Tax=Cacopsylla melanoneura TaxID=428564 RepID=A0A8D8WDT9_9HEMI